MRSLTRGELRELVAKEASAFDSSSGTNPFSCADWMQLFLDQVARDDWRFVVAGSLATGSGLMLLYSEPSAPGKLRALTNYYASLYSPAIGNGESGDFLDIVRSLGNAEDAHSVDLAPLAEPVAKEVQSAFRSVRWMTRRYTCFGNWYLPCDGLVFQDYMKARPSQLVHTWTRKAKKFRRGDEGARLQLVTSPEEVEAAMDAYEAVYAKSWKVPEPYPHFVRTWAAICARRGWLRLGIAWVGESPIAAQFWFTMNRRAYIFKLAYDEAHAKWSAGTVLSAYLFEHSLDVDRVAEIDYLTGDDAYKQSWMTERRERVGVIACNPRTWRGLGRGVYEWMGAIRQRWAGGARVAATTMP